MADVSEALRLFQKANELDPDFAAAYGAAAWCHAWRMLSGWMTNRAQETAEVNRLAGKAAELGRDDALALSFSGFALGYVTGDFEGGLALIDRALTLNPNLAAAWSASGSLRAFRGDNDLAIEHLARAMRLSPLDPLMFIMQGYAAFALFQAGRYDEAWPLAEKACRDRPNFLSAIRIAAASNAGAGRMEEARRHVSRALQLHPKMRISNLKDRVSPLPQDIFAKYIEALRKAGLPE
jgi:tetratricopeptide (TPR) repeat protein